MSTNELNSTNNTPEEESTLPSKTQIKKDMLALTNLGKTIVNFSTSDINKIPLDDELKAAIDAARTMKMGALKRQLQYIGKLLRKRDTEDIQSAVDSILHARQSAGREFKALEQWRERLLVSGADGQTALTEYCAAHPNTDVQRLRQLIRQAQQEKAKGKPPKYFRELFQFIKSDQPD